MNHNFYSNGFGKLIPSPTKVIDDIAQSATIGPINSDTFIEIYSTLQAALNRLEQIRKVLNVDLFCCVDGPDDDFAVMLKLEADESGWDKSTWY